VGNLPEIDEKEPRVANFSVSGTSLASPPDGTIGWPYGSSTNSPS